MGTGGIGTAIALAAKSFGLEVVGLNSDGRAVDGFTTCYPSADRLTFADGLDYLVSVLPQTLQTDNLIDHEVLMRLNPRAIVINAGRGNAVVEADLIASLNACHLKAAVLDVFREEPLPQDDPLWSTPRVHITSHTAGPTLMRLSPRCLSVTLNCISLGNLSPMPQSKAAVTDRCAAMRRWGAQHALPL